jgi:hypothetical protein
MDLLNVLNGMEIGKLNTEQLDKIPALDLHSMLLVEGAEKIPQLIKKLSNEKLQALVDISSWDKDSFNPISFSTWMNILLTFPPEEAAGQLKRINRQELRLFLSSVFDIQWLNQDERYDGNPFITPDNVFVVLPKEEGNTEIQTAIELINISYLAGMDFGRALCVDAMTTSYSIVEEEARRFKEARLSDEGIPSYMDALELFHFEDPTRLLKSILKMVGDDKFKKSAQDKEYLISQFAVVPRSYWDNSFKIDPALVDDVRLELSSLLTASIVLNNVANQDAKRISEVAGRSRSYFNIGLELIKENTSKSLSEVVQFVKLRHIFRLGFSLLVDLKNNATKVKAGIDALNRPDVMNSDDEVFLKALLSTIPMLQLDLADSLKQFETLEQLKQARARLSGLASKLLVS